MTQHTYKLTAAQCRKIDQIAIEEWGIPGIVLMENAGRGAAEIIASHLRFNTTISLDTARLAIICGSGNNGGDGYVIARHLANHGANVRVWMSKPPTTPDAIINHDIAVKMGLVSERSLLGDGLDELKKYAPRAIVDALLGTGAQGPPRDPLPALVEYCESQRAKPGPEAAQVFAIDLPSGMNGDTGAGLCIAANVTITFATHKIGFDQQAARGKLGFLHVVDIGVPPAVIAQAART